MKDIKSNLYNCTWDDVQWPLVHAHVRQIQCRIYEAKKERDLLKVYRIQKILISSQQAKLVAVQQVTTFNTGRQTPGADKQLVICHKEKMTLARNISLNGKAQPIRRIWIPKPGKTEKRPLGIPTIRDRAKQALAKMALEPEWEAVFESNSYAFRPGRSCHDAIEAIFKCLCHKKPKWVYDADIRKCFDRIDHKSLIQKLNTFPIMEAQVLAWLKAGVMEGYSQYPTGNDTTHTTKGTPQGGVISPLLANIALHGLENYLKEYVGELPNNFRKNRYLPKRERLKAIGIVRYADDFVIIHEDRDILEGCVTKTESWLKEVGLETNIEKSQIKDCRQGFVFLGFQIIQTFAKARNAYKVKITPSRESVQNVLVKIRSIIQKNKSVSSYDLIKKLVPIIRGWSNYFRFCECQKAFDKIDHNVFLKLRAWVFRRAPLKGRIELREKYFPKGKSYIFDNREYKDNWVLCGQKREDKGVVTENHLIKMSWVSSRNFVKVKGTATPYDGNYVYWAKRSCRFSYNSNTNYVLLNKQDNKCALCKQPFFANDLIEKDHIVPKSRGGRDTIKNLQLLHKYCHLGKTRIDRTHT